MSVPQPRPPHEEMRWFLCLDLSWPAQKIQRFRCADACLLQRLADASFSRSGSGDDDDEELVVSRACHGGSHVPAGDPLVRRRPPSAATTSSSTSSQSQPSQPSLCCCALLVSSLSLEVLATIAPSGALSFPQRQHHPAAISPRAETRIRELVGSSSGDDDDAFGLVSGGVGGTDEECFFFRVEFCLPRSQLLVWTVPDDVYQRFLAPRCVTVWPFALTSPFLVPRSARSLVGVFRYTRPSPSSVVAGTGTVVQPVPATAEELASGETCKICMSAPQTVFFPCHGPDSPPPLCANGVCETCFAGCVEASGGLGVKCPFCGRVHGRPHGSQPPGELRICWIEERCEGFTADLAAASDTTVGPEPQPARRRQRLHAPEGPAHVVRASNGTFVLEYTLSQPEGGSERVQHRAFFPHSPGYADPFLARVVQAFRHGYVFAGAPGSTCSWCVWQIHHKTRMAGGNRGEPYAWPDLAYLGDGGTLDNELKAFGF